MERFRLDTDHNILFNQEENMTDDQKLEFYKMAFNAIFDRNVYLACRKEHETIDLAVAANAKELAECLTVDAERMLKDIKKWDS